MRVRRKFLAGAILVIAGSLGTLGPAGPVSAADGVCGGVGDCEDAESPPPPPQDLDCDGIDDFTGLPFQGANGVCGG